MESKTFLDFLPTNFRHEKSFFNQNNLTDFEKLSNLSDLDINEIQRKSSLCTLNNLKKIRAIAIFKKKLEFLHRKHIYFYIAVYLLLNHYHSLPLMN